jgi:hypothetical protein
MVEDSLPPPPFKTTAAQWDAVRKKTAVSDFAETPLNTLAQNVGLDGWPLKSSDESPEKYLELTLDELRLMPGFNQRPKLIDQLYFVLRSSMDSGNGPHSESAPAASKPTAAPFKAKPVAGCKTTPAQWDKVRKAFSKSLMLDLKLSSLADNLELDGWPIEGDEETPAKYVEFTLEELSVMGEFHGKPARIDRLFKILNENLSQDEEFEDMVIPINQQLDKTDVLLQVLRKHGIPLDYPFSLLILPKNVRETTPTEQVKTLGQFVQFYQKISEKGVVLGEIKTILQAISSGDEPRMATWMPLRPGVKGFHLIESVALSVKALDQDTLKSLLKKYGKKLEAQDDYMLKSSWNGLSQKGEAAVQSSLAEVAPWFKDDIAQIHGIVSGGESMELDRYLLPLGDSDLELIVAHALLQFTQKNKPANPIATEEASGDSENTGGFFGKIKSLFGRK